ncbi:TIGR01906 family membrane protein [Brevibacterium spongiae]|uniref:TIGR01906 family membrane protein n=1 Tax=Brevibacterium spongiae TaxID=2909672 RepID=A0ABY5SW17_9MICO|nr:TIGR01906 family membrane protein [Brevibacterium spongiae]UVI37291.1 TIGR01906 family membrane protein [Brevibacterium spongiae]
MSRDEKNETEDLLSRRMSSGSASAADKQSQTPLEAANDPSTDTEAFDPITDPIAEDAPKHSADAKPSTGPVRVAPAHSTNPHSQPATASTRAADRSTAATTASATPSSTDTGATREVPQNARTSVMSEADWAAVSKAATSTDARDPEVPERRRSVLDVIGTIWIMLATPFVLLALAVRFVASGLFLKIEYFRPGFPGDQFGFSAADREHYGTYVVDYLHNFDSRRYLADIVMPNGEPVFISDELSHMADVKGLISLLYLVALVGIIGSILFGIYMCRRNGMGIHAGVRLGSIFSIIFMAAVAVVAVLGWDRFFRGFHKVFFADGTWEFYADDSLIRLFPPQFWVDAGIVGGGLFVLLAIILFFSSFAGHKKRRALRKARKDVAEA